MTERDKKVILTMRRNGVSFSAIARTFDLPVGTIKTVCSRGTKPNVAIGFRAQKSNGKYRYFWLYKVQFGIPSVSLQTKGDSISFQTPSIEGTIVRRNKPLGNDKHPWKAEVTEGDAGVSDTTITNWFKAVYEPAYAGD